MYGPNNISNSLKEFRSIQVSMQESRCEEKELGVLRMVERIHQMISAQG